MFQEIVFAKDAVLLVGGGVLFEGDLELGLSNALKVFAADSGAEALLAAGRIPEAVIGDFDSLSAEARATLPPHCLIHVSDQDDTDFEKALARIDAPLVIGVGFTGARLDHSLAALHGLLRFQDKPVVLVGEHEIVLLAPKRIAVDLVRGDTVSLFPLCRVQGRSEGLEWPIDGLTLAPGGRGGTSNRASGGTMTLEMDTPGAVLMVPRARLGAVIQALHPDAPTHVRWPVRA